MGRSRRTADMEGWVPLKRRRILIARSWATLVLEPEGIRYHEEKHTDCRGQVRTETIGQVLRVFRLTMRHGLTGGTRMVVPAKFHEGALTAFLEAAQKLCRREVEYADLGVECGMAVSYRWLDPSTEAVGRAIAADPEAEVLRESVLLVSCDYHDGPVGGSNRQWWYHWLDVDEEIAAARMHLMSFRTTDIMVTRAQFEGLIQAVAELIEESGGRRI